MLDSSQIGLHISYLCTKSICLKLTLYILYLQMGLFTAAGLLHMRERLHFIAHKTAVILAE